jgi:hypothetical protein
MVDYEGMPALRYLRSRALEGVGGNDINGWVSFRSHGFLFSGLSDRMILVRLEAIHPGYRLAGTDHGVRDAAAEVLAMAILGRGVYQLKDALATAVGIEPLVKAGFA